MLNSALQQQAQIFHSLLLVSWWARDSLSMCLCRKSPLRLYILNKDEQQFEISPNMSPVHYHDENSATRGLVPGTFFNCEG